MKVETVDFVAIPTRDVERAVAWYRDVLGLGAGAAGEVEAPNVTFSFWNPAADGQTFQPNVAGVALRVADVKQACDEVVAGSGELVGIEDTGVCHMSFCKDPDGNTVILHRRYSPRA